MCGCKMVVTPSRTEDTESSRFQRKGTVAEGRLELVQAGATPPTHTTRDLPECWLRPLSLIATCIVFVSPKDWEPPGQSWLP